MSGEQERMAMLLSQASTEKKSEIGFQKNIIIKRRKSTCDIIDDPQPTKKIQTSKNNLKKINNSKNNKTSNWQQFMKDNNNSNSNNNGIQKKKLNNNQDNDSTIYTLTPDPKQFKGQTPIIAIDCEMVQCQDRELGQRKMLARISIVNYNGHVLLDTYVNPMRKVLNFLTWVSGIQPHHIKNAPKFKEVEEKYKKIIQGKIIVGHSIQNDFDAMEYHSHDSNKVRDISKYPFLKNSLGKLMSLKNMNEQFLNLKIQSGAHSSVEDARATMLIYRKFEQQIEDANKQINFNNNNQQNNNNTLNGFSNGKKKNKQQLKK